MALGANHTVNDIGHTSDHNLIDQTLAALVAGGGRALATGEAALIRSVGSNNTVGTASGALKLTYFTALKTETITQVRLYIGAVAAGATPTMCRIGVWAAGDDGALTTLVASTPNDTSLLTGSTNSRRTKSLSAGWAKTLGTRYAVGLLVVTGATTPQFGGCFAGVSQETGDGRRWAGNVSGLSDLPSTATAGTVGDASSAIQFHMLQ